MEILICFIITIIIITFAVLTLICLERRIFALFAGKIASNPGGCDGILQPLSDFLKLLQKEDSTPKRSRKFLFFTAPFLVFCPVVSAFCFIPFNDFYALPSADTSIVLFLALTSIPVIGRFLAGFASNNKYALISALRSVIQLISAEIPLVLSILAVTFMAGSLEIQGIIEAQNGPAGLFNWYFIPQIIGAAIFFTSSLTLLNSPPFDISTAENELAAGYLTEYSGVKYAFFYFSKYALLFLVSIIFVSLFFGGYLSPFGGYVLPDFLVSVEQIFWLIFKTFIVIFFIISINAALPRIKPDKVLEFSYKILIPLSLINLNIAVIIQYFMGANR